MLGQAWIAASRACSLLKQPDKQEAAKANFLNGAFLPDPEHSAGIGDCTESCQAGISNYRRPAA
jgi:hypothetical protein